jgi:hypothetical protein
VNTPAEELVEMLEKTLNRIMQGARTPEGKIIAILLTISLSLMTWNAASIGNAVANDDQTKSVAAQEADDKAEKAAAEIKPEPETSAQAEVAEVADPTNATV